MHLYFSCQGHHAFLALFLESSLSIWAAMWCNQLLHPDKGQMSHVCDTRLRWWDGEVTCVGPFEMSSISALMPPQLHDVVVGGYSAITRGQTGRKSMREPCSTQATLRSLLSPSPSSSSSTTTLRGWGQLDLRKELQLWVSKLEYTKRSSGPWNAWPFFL